MTLGQLPVAIKLFIERFVMKIHLVLSSLFLMVAITTAAQDLESGASDISFSDYDSPQKEIEIDKLRWRMEIQGDILVFNKSGTRLLYKADEERKWRFGSDKPITSYWKVTQKGLPSTSLYHEWQFTSTGELKLRYEQFDSMSRNKKGGVKTGKLIQEKEIIVENMSGPSIVIYQDDTKRVVAQFKIQIWPSEKGEDIGRLGINSSRLTIFDNKGNLWASRLDNSSGNNVYFGVTTHLGSLYMSYLPFPGAKKIGIAEKNRIRLEQENVKLSIESMDFLLPKGIQANVYGFIDTNKRSERLNQVHSYGSDKQASFLENIKR